MTSTSYFFHMFYFSHQTFSVFFLLRCLYSNDAVLCGKKLSEVVFVQTFNLLSPLKPKLKCVLASVLMYSLSPNVDEVVYT